MEDVRGTVRRSGIGVMKRVVGIALTSAATLTMGWSAACGGSSDAGSSARSNHAARQTSAASSGPVSIASSAAEVLAADRRAGIDFRALGQEPGWSLTIDDGHQIVFEANSMDDSVVLPAPPPEVYGRTDAETYRVNADGHRLTIVRVARTCHDPITGRVFEDSVTVTFDGESYRGCGVRP